ncbi:leukocyte elastase inhibitor-like [Ornithodoros turicata]|uniref:leukocyte elastase inhibitor-like n=1 Tax=Ornithodoros turicata TaxID=34597 RepID=UPI00313981FF
MEKTVSHANRFSLKLFKRVSSLDPRSTVCLCPFTVFQALSMAYAAAQGNTEQQMAKAFKVTKKYDIHSAFQALLKTLYKAVPDVKQDFACHVFIERSFKCVPAYEALLTEKYLADVHHVEIREEPDKVRAFLNKTVENSTAGAINELVVTGVTDHDSKILFFDSVLLKASWESVFPTTAAVTEKHPFTLMDEGERTAQLVTMCGPYRHYRDDDMKVLVVEIPFKSKSMAMIVFLADNAPSLRRFHKHLSIDLYQKVVDGLQTAKGNISICVPRLRLEDALQPSYTLKHMGFVDLFDEHANLTGAGSTLYVSDIMHKVSFVLDGTGVNAAGAVSITLTDYYTEELPKAYRDLPSTRPYIFVIRNQETGLILFMGSVQDL